MVAEDLFPHSKAQTSRLGPQRENGNLEATKEAKKMSSNVAMSLHWAEDKG